MNNPFKPNEESSFEQGISPTKPVKALSDAAKQQAKNVTNDIVAQLYGATDKSSTDPKDPNAADPQKQAAPPPPPKAANILSGNSNVGDHAKNMARQQYLDKGDAKGAENAMHHMQYYFDETVMTLEDRVKKVRQEEEKKKEEKKMREEEEDQKKKQELEQKNSEVARPVAKGRNRMGPGGKKAKTSMAVDMAKNKTEVFRGASG